MYYTTFVLLLPKVGMYLPIGITTAITATATVCNTIERPHTTYHQPGRAGGGTRGIRERPRGHVIPTMRQCNIGVWE